MFVVVRMGSSGNQWESSDREQAEHGGAANGELEQVWRTLPYDMICVQCYTDSV